MTVLVSVGLQLEDTDTAVAIYAILAWFLRDLFVDHVAFSGLLLCCLLIIMALTVARAVVFIVWPSPG